RPSSSVMPGAVNLSGASRNERPPTRPSQTNGMTICKILTIINERRGAAAGAPFCFGLCERFFACHHQIDSEIHPNDGADSEYRVADHTHPAEELHEIGLHELGAPRRPIAL